MARPVDSQTWEEKRLAERFLDHPTSARRTPWFVPRRRPGRGRAQWYPGGSSGMCWRHRSEEFDSRQRRAVRHKADRRAPGSGLDDDVAVDD